MKAPPRSKRAPTRSSSDDGRDRRDQGWALFNLGLAAGMVREAAALTTQIVGESSPRTSRLPGDGAQGDRRRDPRHRPVERADHPRRRAIAVPLACGNTVILKASENCPRTHSLIVEAFAEAGFPRRVVNVVTNAPRTPPTWSAR
jgi:hypothetical protein